MSLKKRFISATTALALIGSMSFALEISKDGTGDYLIAPVYVATGGWKTDIKVVNTNTTHAIVAKVVIREGNQSKEILDFPIYLTPGDIWKGTIYDDNGVVKVVSKDDSLMLGTIKVDINQTCDDGQSLVKEIIKPYSIGIDQPVNVPFGSNVNKGYVEIFGLAAYSAEKIAKEFNSYWNEGCDLNKTWFFSVVRDAAPDNINSNYAEDVDNSSLIGEQVLINETGSDVSQMRFMKLNMLALKDVATSPKTKQVIAADTRLTNVADITAGDYKNVMLKQHVYVLYDGDGQQIAPFQTIFTFPYKEVLKEDYYIKEDKFIFRDYNEHARACNYPSIVCNSGGCEGSQEISLLDPSNDLSGVISSSEEKCGVMKFEEEVAAVVGPATRNSEVNRVTQMYGWKVGGYIDIDLSDVMLGDGTVVGGLPVIPTTMHAKKVGGIYLNNHLYNQYKEVK